MSVGGYYALELRCDAQVIASPTATVGCDRSEDFVYSTRFQARQMARNAGWLLSQKGNRCLCPDHAAERRKQWRVKVNA